MAEILYLILKAINEKVESLIHIKHVDANLGVISNVGMNVCLNLNKLLVNVMLTTMKINEWDTYNFLY